MRYHASKFACYARSLRPQCSPNTPAREILRSSHEGTRRMTRDIAQTDAYVTSRRERKKVERLELLDNTISILRGLGAAVVDASGFVISPHC